jgi:hypothetical protein
MAYVENTTGTAMLYKGHAVQCLEVIEVTDLEAISLVRCGWSVPIDKSASNQSGGSVVRSAGKRGALPETETLYKPLDSYFIDAVGLPKPTSPFLYGNGVPIHLACNDRLGDCTCAGWVNGAEISAEISGVSYVYPGDNAVEVGYFSLTDGEDTGLQLTQVIKAGSKPGGFLGLEVVGAASVDIHDFDLVKTVLYNFGWLYLAFALPQSAEDDFAQGLPWRVSNPASEPVGGHCVVGNGTKPVLAKKLSVGLNLLDLESWGSLTECSEDFWKVYGLQAFVLVPKWYVTQGHDAVQHLNQAAMLDDLREIAQCR